MSLLALGIDIAGFNSTRWISNPRWVGRVDLEFNVSTPHGGLATKVRELWWDTLNINTFQLHTVD